MPRKRSFTSQVYRAARVSNNISAVASGNPKRVTRRAKNVAVIEGVPRGVGHRREATVQRRRIGVPVCI